MGVVYAETGRPHLAKAEYDKAVAHAREHDDRPLLGRVLHNLAVLSADDPDEAHRLLDESLALKKAEDDTAGVIHVHLTRGLVHALAGARDEARKAYARAERLSRRHDRRHLLVMALQESAAVATEDGRGDDAVAALREAHQVAADEGYERLERRTRSRLGRALARTGDLGEAAALFEQAYRSEEEGGATEDVVEALYNWAVAVLQLGDDDEARRLLDLALRHTRTANDVNWTGRVRLASAFSVSGGEPSVEGVRRLLKFAREEAKGDRRDVAAWLLDRRSRALVVLGSPDGEIEAGFRDAEAALQQARDESGLVGLYASWFAWRREAGGLSPEGVEASLEPLRQMQTVAEAAGDDIALAQAVDEEAVSLQHLGRYAEAEPLHRRSLRVSRQASDSRGEVVSLTNLGELYRKTDRPEKAITLYDRAVQIAQAEGDDDAELTLLHNRALAFEAVGRTEEAEQSLRDARRRAQTLGAWGDQARASIALGDLAWEREGRSASVQHYRRAFEAAQKHGEAVVALKAALAWGYSLSGSRGAEAARRRIRGLMSDETVNALGPRQRFTLHRVLAELAEALGDLDDAEAMWATAASLAPDQDSGALAWGATGDIRRRRGDGAAADDALQEAFRREADPDGQAALLYDRFHAVALTGDDDALESVFDEAREHMEEHALHLRLVDLHMAAGDHQWEGGAHEEAIQLYIAAAVYGFQETDDVEGEQDDEGRAGPLVEVPFHVLDRLLEIALGEHPDLGRPLVVVESLQEATRRWVEETMGAAAPVAERVLLWPFRAAVRFAAAPRLARDASAVQDILMEETRAAFDPRDDP